MKQYFILGVLVKKDQCLAKQRRFWREIQFIKTLRSRYEEEVFFPKGIIKEDETPEQALERQVRIDIGVRILHSSFLGEFFYRDGCQAKVFLIDSWNGEFKDFRGQGKLFWLKQAQKLTNEFDRHLLFQIQKRLAAQGG